MTREEYKKRRSLKRKYKRYNEAVYYEDLSDIGFIRSIFYKIVKLIRRDKEPIDIHEIDDVSNSLDGYEERCVRWYLLYFETKDEDFFREFEMNLEETIEYIKSNYEIIEFLEYKEKMEELESRDSFINKLRYKIEIIRYRINKEIDYFCGGSSSVDRFHDTSSGL